MLCFNSLIEKVIRKYHEKGRESIRAELYIYICPTNDIRYVEERILVTSVDKGNRGSRGGDGYYNLEGKNINTGYRFNWYLRPSAGSKKVLQVTSEYGRVVLYVGSRIVGATNPWNSMMSSTLTDRHTIKFK